MVLEHEIREFIPINIKVIRKENNLTQQKFADLLEVKRNRVGAWEEKRGVPPLEILVRISEYFGLDLKKFLTEKLCD
jgi:transcriptional regulator with XRE-family HTH domain